MLKRTKCRRILRLRLIPRFNSNGSGLELVGDLEDIPQIRELLSEALGDLGDETAMLKLMMQRWLSYRNLRVRRSNLFRLALDLFDQPAARLRSSC